MDKLTLKELRQMSGQPVWCKDLEVYGIIKCESKGRWSGKPFLVGVFYSSEYGVAHNFEYDIQRRMGIKVTRDMLDRYRKLKQEIPVLELELLMMKNTEAGLGNDTIFDYQTGYPRPQSVIGFDQKKYDRREKVLERKKEKVKAMDQWIDDIKDGQTRCVFRMFYKQNMTWKAIAKQIGMPHNEDYPRLMIRDKYLKNQGIK